ncbi:hypothetical protein LSAT2_030092 [Lamellibrachia satsuma]|nr:hypothetical protein LSAT2_030092 [Lamellibrachia satsuma]
MSIAKDAFDKDITIKIAVSHNGQDRSPQNEDHKSMAVDVVFLDHFCVFTVVNKKTGSKMLAKGVNALVYADYVASSRKMRFTSHCVDNEVTETELFKYIQARDNDAVLVGTQPFIVHDNNNPIVVSMSNIASSWKLQDAVPKAISDICDGYACRIEYGCIPRKILYGEIASGARHIGCPALRGVSDACKRNIKYVQTWKICRSRPQQRVTDCTECCREGRRKNKRTVGGEHRLSEREAID